MCSLFKYSACCARSLGAHHRWNRARSAPPDAGSIPAVSIELRTGIAKVAFGALYLRELAILASPYACMHMGASGCKQHAGAVCLTPYAPRPCRTRFPHNFNQQIKTTPQGLAVLQRCVF